MVELRNLEEKDAPFMLEWMHDDDLVKDMRADFKSKTLEDCQSFIQVSQTDRNNAHFAVADSDDAYMGTVSLKNIDLENKAAEFAICMRRCTLGNGMAAEAMKKVMDKAFQEMGLKTVYWSVNPESKRAVRFYDKNGYIRIKEMDNFCRRLILTGGGVQSTCLGAILVVHGKESQSGGNSGKQLNIDVRFPLKQLMRGLCKEEI